MYRLTRIVFTFSIRASTRPSCPCSCEAQSLLLSPPTRINTASASRPPAAIQSSLGLCSNHCLLFRPAPCPIPEPIRRGDFLRASPMPSLPLMSSAAHFDILCDITHIPPRRARPTLPTRLADTVRWTRASRQADQKQEKQAGFSRLQLIFQLSPTPCSSHAAATRPRRCSW
ncbi:hypothetical protein L226DRAFT_73885 [Lentinus tigrinus ALCF2SS1-7]|uniref:uncharacterized protein n=1 Tax=Lentinus tigrinus ALCF2SS1-7 TaxID=1328758 RepID=UPI001166233D|nr:hypothetical protein L226DRAFT_73885 [Lentinus tigrinus ALCF2SS1-7]